MIHHELKQQHFSEIYFYHYFATVDLVIEGWMLEKQSFHLYLKKAVNK